MPTPHLLPEQNPPASGDKVMHSCLTIGSGGEVQAPLCETFFAKSFGMVADRFGVSWMVIAGPKNP